MYHDNNVVAVNTSSCCNCGTKRFLLNLLPAFDSEKNGDRNADTHTLPGLNIDSAAAAGQCPATFDFKCARLSGRRALKRAASE